MRTILFSLIFVAACGDDAADPTTTETMETMETMEETMETETMPTMDVCETDICATYGAAVPVVAGLIVDEAAADPQFADAFAPLVAEGADAVTAFKESLTFFISDAYGCSSGLYVGPSMEDSHEGMEITQADYDDFIGLIAGVLAGAGVPEDDINLCFAPPLVDEAFSSTIVGQ